MRATPAPASKFFGLLPKGPLRRRTRNRQTERMESIAIVVLIVLLALPLALVGVTFVWAAIRDGEEDRALQRRLGIRRKTRLGR